MKAYLIPGSGEGLTSRNYKAVLNVYKDCGYEPEFLPIGWKYKTIDDWIDQVERAIPRDVLQESLLSGFSFGSMIALAVAARNNPERLLLFSLSPYFKEDFPLPTKYEVWAGKRRIENFKRLSFDQLAARIACPTTIFLGDEERRKYGDKRTVEAYNRIRNSKLTMIDGAVHDITGKNYLEAIRKELQT